MKRKVKGGASIRFDKKGVSKVANIFGLHRKVAFFAIVAISLANSSVTWANKDAEVKPLKLKIIMQELGENMQKVTDAISREDWGQVAETAPLIADHPQPPLSEKFRILAFAGSNVDTFKDYDKQAHDAAKALEQAALAEDGKGAIEKFAELQTSCLACHQSFRKAFQEHFYGQK